MMRLMKLSAVVLDFLEPREPFHDTVKVPIVPEMSVALPN